MWSKSKHQNFSKKNKKKGGGEYFLQIGLKEGPRSFPKTSYLLSNRSILCGPMLASDRSNTQNVQLTAHLAPPVLSPEGISSPLHTVPPSKQALLHTHTRTRPEMCSRAGRHEAPSPSVLTCSAAASADMASLPLEVRGGANGRRGEKLEQEKNSTQRRSPKPATATNKPPAQRAEPEPPTGLRHRPLRDELKWLRPTAGGGGRRGSRIHFRGKWAGPRGEQGGDRARAGAEPFWALNAPR